MSKLRVLSIVGTRPEIIRLSRVIARLEGDFSHRLVHTGQNYDYELNQVFFADLAMRKPDYFLEAVGGTLAETIGNIISKVDPVLEDFRPDALLVLGDTNSTLAVIPAKRRKIPIFHMEAGNRCFDHRVPEEINRRIVDHTSDVNLPYSTLARENLLREGLPPDLIIKIGSPMYEVLQHAMPQIESSNILEQHGLICGEYYLVSCHREENVDVESNIRSLLDTLNRLADTRQRRIIVSTHPRTRLRIDSMKIDLDPRIELLKPLGFFDYIKLQQSAAVVLSDSGTITEEASILDLRALNLRDTHERPEGMEEGAVMMTGVSWERVSQGLLMLEASGSLGRQTRLVRDYDAPLVSQTVSRIILSYVDYVNHVIWRKY